MLSVMRMSYFGATFSFTVWIAKIKYDYRILN